MTLSDSWTTPAVKDFIWRGSTLYVMGSGRIAIMDVTDPHTPVTVGAVE
jgi:hypothetical protein